MGFLAVPLNFMSLSIQAALQIDAQLSGTIGRRFEFLQGRYHTVSMMLTMW